jgi:hypothetical protein
MLNKVSVKSLALRSACALMTALVRRWSLVSLGTILI